MKLLPVSSDRKRVRVLSQLVATHDDQRFSNQQLSQAAALRDHMTAGLQAASLAQAARSQAIEQANVKLHELARHTAYFWQTLQGRARYYRLSLEYLCAFRLPTEAGKPFAAELRDHIGIAERLLAGEDWAVAWTRC